MSPIGSAHLGMLLCAAVVGASFPLVEQLSAGLPPLLSTAIRFAVAAIALAAVAGRPRLKRLPVRTLALYAVMGLSLGGFFGAMFWAAGRSSALSLSAIYLTVPLLAYLLGRSFGVERPAPALLALLVLGAAGALALTWARNRGAGQFQLGAGDVAFAAGCGACAFYPVLSRWGLNNGWLPDSAAERTLGSLLAGAVIMGIAGVLIEPSGALMQFSSSDWIILIYLGLVSSGLTFWLTQRATATLTPAVVTAYSYLTPFVSLLLLLAQEPALIGWQWMPGSALIVATMTLLLLRDLMPPKPLAGTARTAASEGRSGPQSEPLRLYSIAGEQK